MQTRLRAHRAERYSLDLGVDQHALAVDILRRQVLLLLHLLHPLLQVLLLVGTQLPL
jgi:hypothetical protein